MARVRLENVSRVFQGGVRAVDRINLEVHDREFLVIVGPSGCGKSTTLRMIAGLDEADEGTISIGDRVVNDVAPKDRDVAMVFQNYALYPHMSVYRNLAFALELRSGISSWKQALFRLSAPTRAAAMAAARFDIASRVQAAAKVLGIQHLLDRQPRQLSGGERQRVALGRAMVREPAVFLFDEPLSNLDAKLRVEMRRELKQLHQRLAATMIYVTHDQVEAMTLGQRIVVMNQGAVQQVGCPQELYRRPKNQFVAGFLGSPPMNFLPVQTDDSHGAALIMDGASERLTLSGVRSGIRSGSKLVLGIRPEHLRVVPTSSVTEVKGPSKKSGTRLSAQVELVESLGDETLNTFTLTGTPDSDSRPHSLVCKMPADFSAQTGDHVLFEFDLAQAHLFDAETGENCLNSDE